MIMKRNIILISIFITSAVLMYFLFWDSKEAQEGGGEVVVDMSMKDRLREDVEVITSVTPPRNHNNIESLNKVANHIFGEFEKTGCELQRQYFSVNEKEYQNVICSFGVENSKRIVVGAHYDVDGNTPGADDNASAVAGLLELARLMHKNNPKLEYRIDFVAYSLEELPHFRTDNMGSAVHAKSLADEGVEVELMIALEMIGYFTDEKDSQKYPSPVLKPFYPDQGNFIAIVGKFGQGDVAKKVKNTMTQNCQVDVQSLSAPKSLAGIDFSDHQNYWKQGFNAVMITDTSFYRNPNYHKKTDTMDTLDFEKMAQVVNGVYHVIVEYQ